MDGSGASLMEIQMMLGHHNIQPDEHLPREAVDRQRRRDATA